MHVNLSIPNAIIKLVHPGTKRKRIEPGVGIPGHFLQWLGISAQQFSTACAEHALRTIPYLDAACGDTKDIRSVQIPCPDELEETVTYAACVATDSLPAELGAAHSEARQMWRRKIAASYTRILAFFKQQRPAVVVLVQGFEPHNAVARCAALRLDIPLLAIENTALANRMVWDNVSGITTNRSVARNYYWRYYNNTSRVTSDAYCRRLIEKTKQLKSDEHRSPATRRHHSCNRPTVLFLGQVYTDASQVFGLRRWPTPMAALQSCVRWCRQHQHDLVVKLHPKESTGNNTIDDRPYNRLTYRKIMGDKHLARELNDLNAIVDEDNSYDTYELIDHCAVAVTVNSQAGLEAAIRGKPVVVCGDAFYGGLDFTCDAPGAVYFDSAMQAAVRREPETTVLARQFAYIFFEQYCREKNAHALLQLVRENI